MSNVNQVIAKFRRALPGIDETRAQQIFNDAHRIILARTRLREVTIQVSLTNGTREYDLTETALLILAAEYRQTATSYRALSEISVDALDENHAGWRSNTITGTPLRYYIIHHNNSNTAKMQVGFYPTPNTTTATGYPIVDIHAIREATLANTDAVPPQLLSDAVYVSVMCEQACREIESFRDQWQFWNGLKDKDLAENVVWVKSREERLGTRLQPRTTAHRII